MKNTAGPMAVVLGSQDTFRCLGRMGINVIVAYPKPDFTGFFSRYCKKSVLLSDFWGEPETVITKLIEIARGCSEPPVLFTCGDADLLLVSRNRAKLSPHYRLNLPDAELVEALVDKIKFYEMALNMGWPIAQTFFPNRGATIETIARDVRYPCVLKPAYPDQWRKGEVIKKLFPESKAIVLHTPETLIHQYDEFAKYSDDLLVQEYVPGEDWNLYTFHAYYDSKSQPLGFFCGRKLMNYPTHVGFGCLNETVFEPALHKLSCEILECIRFRGLVKLDFKWDGRDKSWKLFEINPRSSWWVYLGMASGVNLPYLAYLDVCGMPVPKVSSYRRGYKWVFFTKAWQAFQDYRRQKQLTWWDGIRAMRGPKVYHIFAWDDPAPLWYWWKNYYGHRLAALFR